jgi:hypothetical protein
LCKWSNILLPRSLKKSHIYASLHRLASEFEALRRRRQCPSITTSQISCYICQLPRHASSSVSTRSCTLEAATVSSALLQDAVAKPGVTAPTRRHVHALELVSRAQRYSTNQVSRDRSAHRKLVCSSALHVEICTRAVPICKPDLAKVTRAQHCAVLEQCVHSRLPPSDSPPTRPLQRYMYA